MRRRASQSQPSGKSRFYDSSTIRASSTWKRLLQTRRMLWTSRMIKVHQVFFLTTQDAARWHVSTFDRIFINSPQGLSIWFLNTWTTIWWDCWSLAWSTSTRATSSLSWDSCWRALITATRRISFTETSNAPTFCSITSKSSKLFVLFCTFALSKLPSCSYLLFMSYQGPNKARRLWSRSAV